MTKKKKTKQNKTKNKKPMTKPRCLETHEMEYLFHSCFILAYVSTLLCYLHYSNDD